MRINLIAAVSDNNVIGRNNQIPWRLPDDFAWFKRKTEGHHVIMGRRTWESIGRPLPLRVNVVVSSSYFDSRERMDNAFVQRQPPGDGWLSWRTPPRICIVGSLIDALLIAGLNHEEEAFVIGGYRLYDEAMPKADRLYLTRVHTTIEDGDTFFPKYDASRWLESEVVEHAADDRHEHAFTMRTFDRIR